MVGTLRFAHPTDPSHASTFSRHVFARALQVRLPLFEKRAQGMPGARCTRGLVCRNCAFRCTRAYRAAETLRHPLRNGFTAYIALSPVSGLVCHRRRRDTSRQLSASIATPGPHDFAVRSCSSVRAPKARLNKSVHRISRPTCRDDRETPLGWAGMGGVIILIYRIVK